MSKILVTGAEGFIGSNLVRRLYEEHEVMALDYIDLPPKNIPKEVTYTNNDLSSSFDLPIFLWWGKPDLIMHFATINQEAVSHEPRFEQVNVKAMMNILEFCRNKDVPLIFASSCSVYGTGVLHKEANPLDPRSLYAVGKVVCEEYAKFYHKIFNFDVTILRFSNVYGDTTDISNKRYPGKKDVIRIFMEKALADEPLPIIEGKQTRDFTFIDDAVEAICKVIGVNGLNIFNVATGVETSIWNLAFTIGSVLGKNIQLEHTPKRKIDNIPRRSLDITGISNLWKPKWSLKKGLEEYARRMKGGE